MLGGGEGRELLPDSTWTVLPSQYDTGTHVQFVRKSLFADFFLSVLVLLLPIP